MRTIATLILLFQLMSLSSVFCAEKEFEYSMPVLLLPVLRVLHERDGGKLSATTPEDSKPLKATLSMEISDAKDSRPENGIERIITLASESCGVVSTLHVRNGIVMQIEQDVAGVSTTYRQICDGRLAAINFKDKEYEKISKEALLDLLYRNDCPFGSLPTGKYSVILKARSSNAKDAFRGDVIIDSPVDALYSFSLGYGGWLSHASIRRGGTELDKLKFSVTFIGEGMPANVSVSDVTEKGPSLRQAYFHRNLGLKAYIVRKDGEFAPVEIWKEGGTEKRTMTIEEVWRNPSVIDGEAAVDRQRQDNASYDSFKKTFDASICMVAALKALVGRKGDADAIYREFELDKHGIDKRIWRTYVKRYTTLEKIAKVEKVIPVNEEEFRKQYEDAISKFLEGGPLIDDLTQQMIRRDKRIYDLLLTNRKITSIKDIRFDAPDPNYQLLLNEAEYIPDFVNRHKKALMTPALSLKLLQLLGEIHSSDSFDVLLENYLLEQNFRSAISLASCTGKDQIQTLFKALDSKKLLDGFLKEVLGNSNIHGDFWNTIKDMPFAERMAFFQEHYEEIMIRLWQRAKPLMG